jgi:chromosome segregation ATPase
MTTTIEAIHILENIKNGLENQNAGNERVINSYNIAISQLQGLLDTPSADLVQAQQTIESLQSDIHNLNITIETKNQELEVKINELNDTTEELNAKNTELEEKNQEIISLRERITTLENDKQ